MESSNKKYLRKNRCVVCGKEFTASGNCKYCSPECRSSQKERNLHTIICKNCGKEAKVYKNAKFCSDECRIYYKNRQQTLRKQDKRNKELQGTENIDYVKCQICGVKARQLGEAHLKSFHNMDMPKYKQLYPKAVITSQNFIQENLSGSNNPCSAKKSTKQEIRERSPFCKEFYEKRNIDLSERDNLYEMIGKKRIPNTRIEFYTNRGYTLEEAKILLTERQRTGKYGSHSKESEQFIKELFTHINDNCNYKYGNYEFKLKNPKTKKYYFYDFTDIQKKKIIEFNGDFWHVNENNSEIDLNAIHPISKKAYKDILQYDKEKYKYARKNGYSVLVIWESEYKENPNAVIEKCIQFLAS